ncbi:MULTISPECIES: hypothetical protein [unclassified Bradyrhizobium]|uniref:hypothetical protein n=1 Tax=unclassified Bradyrhizobium TaxID=2631580 RepID=UPI001BA9AD7F|nr:MULTISPECIES: hypothetical protein [unclassified Bradyrhizobium]MBR1229855.1 hypothetical protein [Bradyrhizobium sp. AUGA SZCCT0176]MBR1232307.1 hypothetical protein [Bradyrhizobium sp. AUGA SZCCT0182]MBR1281926.1 hypothetical protein [Bradyrhizobium sp. AUGA SZCCT0177]MBR1297675.1 hypothetical protein [Bradyrhizobium sp. AUGA SZCCT0042]
MTEGNTAHEINGELSLDQLDAAAGGLTIGPITYEDGILAIGIKGVGGIFVGAGCIGGWLGGTAIAYCPK